METISTKRVINGASREVQARHNCRELWQVVRCETYWQEAAIIASASAAVTTHRAAAEICDFCGATRYPCQAKPRKLENSHANSNGCKAGFAGRGPVDKALWRSIIELEVYAGRDWHETISSDGVMSQVATLRPRALREVP